MEHINITGGYPLYGETDIHGAKNAVLPVLAATILCDDECVIHNCPHLSDVETTMEILCELGCKVKREDKHITVNSKNLTGNFIPHSLMTRMRSSIIFLGSILARQKTAVVCFPGGCELGPRPIDLHIKAFRKLGVKVYEAHGFLHCDARDFTPTKIHLDFPSVGATENIMLLSCTSEGETTIINAAREPEIQDLQDFLNSMGAKVSGAGSSIIRIQGVDKLHSTEHSVIPDRIVASTYLSACMCAGGKILINKVNPLHLQAFVSILDESGAKLDIYNSSIEISAPDKIKNINMIRTSPYPGFPTDSQSIAMSMLSMAEGTSLIKETIFEGRFRHASELMKMGADIRIEGDLAVIQGVSHLKGTDVYAKDLRSGAGLIVAALGAEGESNIYNTHYIDRGYDSILETLKSLGAKSERKN